MFNYSYILFSLNDFFIKMFLLESNMRPNCFWSFVFATTVPLNIICRWFRLDILQENKTLVACLVGSGLNSNFHRCVH